MSEHLPDCEAHLAEAAINAGGWDYGVPCICERLRAAEQRVLDTIRRDSWYEDGFNDALDKAWEAVANCPSVKWYPNGLVQKEALAAIAALKEKP